MSYLEQNRQYLGEIREKGFSYKPREATNHGSTAEFIPVGAYASELAGREVALGIKVADIRYSDDRTISRLAKELVIMEYLITHIPRLAVELPLFYGLLTDEENNVIGILTEDFTNGGVNSIEDGAPKERGLYEVLSPVLEDLDYDHVGFRVTNSETGEQKRRLSDFYPAGFKSDELLDKSYDIYDELYEEGNPYSVQIKLQND